MLSKIKIIGLILLSPLFLVSHAGAVAPAASILIAGGTYEPGATFSVDIIEDSGTAPINVVVANLLFDINDLQFIGLDTSNSDFAGSIPSNANPADISAGKVDVTMFSISKITGSAKVATATFKQLKEVSTIVKIDPSDAAVLKAGTNIWDKVPSSATFKFVAPAATTQAPPPTQSPAQLIKPTVPAQQSPQQQATFAPVPSTKALATSVARYDSVPLDVEPVSDLVKILVAAGLAAVAMVAMYFDAHTRVARHARSRIAHKKMLINARLKVRQAKSWQG